MGITIVDDRCKECKKDWTKCGCCPVSMEWVKKQKEINKKAKEKDVTGSTVVNIVDRTAYTMPEGDYYSAIAITCNKGPEN